MTTDATPTQFTAADGYVLTGTHFAASTALRGRLIIAGATAVPQGFYRRFARFANTRGFDAITIDYRGIGQSRPPCLKSFRMNLLDWGRQDLAAVVDAVADDQVPLYLVGHSYGGHAFGLLPNHHKIAGFYVFGTGAGWHGYMPWSEQLRVLTMWRLVFPILTWWKGYCPWQMLGLGEDLPTDAYRQWRHWCQFPHYFFDDPEMTGIEKGFAAVNTPITAANALDDRWASPRSRDAFIKGYRNAPITREDLDPREVGGKVGHMGYFRQGSELLWERALEWFAGLPRQTVAQ